MPTRKRLRFLVASGAALIGAVVLFVYIRYTRPIGSGPAGPAIPRSAFTRPWTSRPVLLLGLGDSITAGFGATPGHSYFERLTRNPADEFPDMQGISLKATFPNLRESNKAVSGSTSPEHLERQVRRLGTAGPGTLGWVVMTTGGNDIIHNYGRTPPREGAMYGATYAHARPWVDRFEKRLDLMVRLIESRFPGGCRIFLADIYDPTDGNGDIERAGLPAWPEGLRILHDYNAAIARVAQKHPHVYLVNLHDLFSGHGIHCNEFWGRHYDLKDPHYWYFSNLEDPNDRGYDAIRRVFLLEMIKAASDTPTPATRQHKERVEKSTFRKAPDFSQGLGKARSRQ